MSPEEVWHIVSIQKTRHVVCHLRCSLILTVSFATSDGRISRYLSWYNESFGEPVFHLSPFRSSEVCREWRTSLSQKRPKHCSSTKVYMFHLRFHASILDTSIQMLFGEEITTCFFTTPSADDMASIDGLVKKQVIISSSK
jgi:hypothetical protein